MDKMWKTYSKWVDKCYTNMIGQETDFSVWEKTFHILSDNIREEKKRRPEIVKNPWILEDELEYGIDISGWLEDFFDEMDMHREYEVLLQACKELLSLFHWEEFEDSDLRFRIGSALESLGRIEEAEKYCESWYNENIENVLAAVSFIYAKIAAKDYVAAEVILERHMVEPCNEENDILYTAAERLYEASGNKKKLKEIQKINKEYEKKVNQMFLVDEIDEDDLPFN